MRNLIIVGNGFDLAHGLKTSYSDFLADLKKNNYVYDNINVRNNRLLDVLASENEKNLWSDIESTYFDILTNLQSEYIQNTYGFTSYYDSKQLNNEFEEIKKCLEIYLIKEEEKFALNDNYIIFFETLSKHETVILNFNYTNTVKKYIENLSLQPSLIHIHGKLNDEKNPIIFGYAADEEESKRLLTENDNEYARNIKKFNYLFTNNEEILKNYLDSDYYNVFILGHSCGISDKLILSNIFRSKKIGKIYIFHYQNRNGYFNTMVNIDRIIDDYSINEDGYKYFSRLAVFSENHEMSLIKKNPNFLNSLNILH